MCGGKAKVDDSIQRQMLADSQAARAEEEARKARIKAGTAKIDDVFGGFDNDFFDRFKQEQLDYYLPQLDNQFTDAKDDLTFAHARAGTLKSSSANDNFADLTSKYTDQKAGVVSDALAGANDLRGQVQNEKSSLVSLLNATGDSDRAANEALSRSQVLFKKQPSYNPLGEIFAGVANGVGNYYSGKQAQQVLNAYYTPGAAGGSGSARTVGG